MEKLPIEIALSPSFFEEETRHNYHITRQSKQVWAVLLDLMVKFDAVCKEHDIKYSIDSGTLLGAVRHQGFIPWDNDADVVMLRSEYERLCKVGDTAFKHPYFLQTNTSDPGSMRRHGQLRNSLTTGILKAEMEGGKPRFSFNQGIFLDIFILDEVPDDPKELKTFRNELQQSIALLWDMKEYYLASGGNAWIQEAQQQAYEQFEKLVGRYNGTGQLRVGNMSLLPNRREETLFPKEIFQHLTLYPFEGFSFPGPTDHQRVLEGFYGDWHKMVIGNDEHGGMFIDVFHPYTKYIGTPMQTTTTGSSQEEENPILKLYHHRDALLTQRDEAWNSIKQLEEETKQLKQENEAKGVSVHTLLKAKESLIGQLDKQAKEINALRRKVKRLRKRFRITLTVAFILLAISLILMTQL